MVIYDIKTNTWYKRRYKRLKIGHNTMLRVYKPMIDNTIQEQIIYFIPVKHIGDGWVVISKDSNQIISDYAKGVDDVNKS